MPSSWLRCRLERLRVIDEGSAAIVRAGIEQLKNRETLRELRLDTLLTYALLVCAIVLYGRHWPLLAGSLLIRAFAVSVADNVHHYATSLSDRRFAKNLSLPYPLNWMFLHFNLHGLHHENPGIPWIHLPAVYASRGLPPPQQGWFGAARAQFKGPLPLIQSSGED